MKERSNNQHSNYFDYQLDITELLRVLWKNKLIIISFTSFATLASVIYSLLLPNIFQSKAILIPQDGSSNVSSALKGYSGIAGIAGIKLPSGVDQSNSSRAIEKLRSLSFFEQNILPNIFLPDLMALSAWDYKSNLLYYDDDIYSINTNTWVRNYSYPQKLIPSSQESFDQFTTKHFEITEDQETGFITLSIKHQSPFLAKEWLELMVNQINLFFRDKDKSQAVKLVNYLNEQIETTNLTEVRQAISSLLKEETKKLALIEANQNYVFDYIDPPAVMEKKSEPRRALIGILGAILGGIFSILYLLIKNYPITNKATRSQIDC